MDRMKDSEVTGREPEENASGEESFPPIWARYFMVFFSPGKLFEHLRAKPAWGVALVLGALLVLIAGALMPPEVFLAQMKQRLIEQGQSVPEGLEIGGTVFRLFAAVGGFLVWFIITSLMAGLTALIFTFILGGEGTYRQYLALTAHAFLISATSNLALLPLRISAENPQLLLSVGTFLPFLPDGYVASFFGLLDLFGLWAWVLVGLGVSRLDGKRSWGATTAILLIIPVGMAALFAIFV